MQALILALGAFAAIPTVLATANAQTTACNANNCARDVTGTREGKLPLLEVRKTDCANFMTATVYATPTATPHPNVVYNRKMKRDPVTVKGQTVPSYVKQCDANTVSYASVCSCWGYTATTITVTTPTTTVAPPVASCTKGVQWAYYALQQGTGSGRVPSHSNISPYWDTFSPNNIKGLTPFSTGWGKRMSIGKGQGECIASPAYVNGVAQASGSHHAYSVLQARGYIVADRVTTYHIYFNSADELLLGWFGDEAKGNWNSGNAQLVTGRYAYRAIQAKAGDVIPFRILYVNAQGCYSFGFTIYKETPGQVGWDVVLSSDYDNNSNNIVQSCSGALASKAPAFPDWKLEGQGSATPAL